MTDLQKILKAVEAEPLTVSQIAAVTGYSEFGVKMAVEFMVIRPKEYKIRTFVSKGGKTYSYQSGERS